jgi:D-glycero-D-manno-heptose 1,7-bisphosphate phosphatase
MLIWINSPEPISGKFLFLDRDGVINEDSPHYIKNRREFRFYADALEALRLLREKRVNVIVISNQSGLHRGIIKRDDFWEMHDYMISSIREAGGDILATFYCPHRPDENCACRKPSPAMIFEASRLYGTALSRATFMIGDRLKDLEAADRAGCAGILLERTTPSPPPHGDFGDMGRFHKYPTLMEAVLSLLESGKA